MKSHQLSSNSLHDAVRILFMVNTKFQISLIGFLVVIFAVGPVSAQISSAAGPPKTCGDREQGYGRSQNPPVIHGTPYRVPELRFQITDDQTGRPTGDREVIVRYVWRWFEYPYPERLLGVWSDAYDLVRCTSNKDGLVLLAEFEVTPLGWYKGKMLMGRKPEFTHLDVSVHLENQITHIRVTKAELEGHRKSNANRIPLRVSAYLPALVNPQ
jgi:hypothetical protein